MHEAGQWERLATRDRDAEALQRLKEAGVQVQTLTGEAREQLRQRSCRCTRTLPSGWGRTTSSGCMPRSRRPPRSVWSGNDREVTWRTPGANHRHRAVRAATPAQGAPGPGRGLGCSWRPGSRRRPSWPCSCRWGVSPPGSSAATSCTGPSPGRMRCDPRPGLADVSGGRRRAAAARPSTGQPGARRRASAA